MRQARKHGARRERGLAAYAIVYLVFLYGPVALLPLFSFNDSPFIFTVRAVRSTETP